jgi:hypothetical protein
VTAQATDPRRTIMRVERIAIPRGLPVRLVSQAAAVFALGFLPP